MDDLLNIFARATGGHKEVPDEWVSGTGLRALIQEDPCLLWLKHHGAAYGFEEDPAEYSFLNWIGDKGRAFEAAWVKNVAPDAVQALEEDVDVRHAQGFLRTLELMARRIPVITKAALWWAPAKIYGSADVLVLSSWLYERFPHLKPKQDEPDHYLIIDCKFSTALDESDKKTDLACNSAQVRMYSYIVGQLQGFMPQHAYLVTRDRPFDPLSIPVDHRLGGPLDPRLAQLRDLHTHIKLHGHHYLPWRDKIVVPNLNNKKDEPWHQAKKRIAQDYLPGGPLEWLPHVGRGHVEALNLRGFPNLRSLMAVHPDAVDFEGLQGIGKITASRIRAVLHANRSGHPSLIPAALVPQRAAKEYFVDYEYLSNVNVDFDNDWPAMAGREMVFMVGIGWEEGGQWNYRQFVAEAERIEAERAMFQDLLRFLEQEDVLNHGSSAVFYHWSNAEVWQSRNAAERHRLPQLANLPWADLQKPAHAIPIGLPGAWGYGLKEIATALGRVSPKHLVEWPEGLADGLSASVMGWRMYEQPSPPQTPELEMLSQYLEIDCKAMWAVLSWMRAVAVEGHWYAPAKQKRKTNKPTTTRPKQKRQNRKPRSRRKGLGEMGWYRFALTVS